MAIIPSTNLPVFLQKYTVAITDGSVSWALISANPSNRQLYRVWSFQLNGTLSHTTRDTYVIEYNLDNVESEYVISFEGTAIGTLTLSNTAFVVNEKNLTFTYIDTPTQKRIVLRLDAKICPVKEGRPRPFLLDFYLNDAACISTPSNLVYNVSTTGTGWGYSYSSQQSTGTLSFSNTLGCPFPFAIVSSQTSSIPNLYILQVSNVPGTSWYLYSGNDSTIATPYYYTSTGQSTSFTYISNTNVFGFSPDSLSYQLSATAFSINFQVHLIVSLQC
jgi:hypothetical protein